MYVLYMDMLLYRKNFFYDVPEILWAELRLQEL